MRRDCALGSVYLLVATLAAAQQPTVDPNTVPASTRSTWCASELNTCTLLCNNDPKANECNPNTLTSACTCANGVSPQLEQYRNSLPSLVCNEAFSQCVSSKANDAAGQQSCKDDIQSKCGTKEATASASSNSSPSNSPSSLLVSSSTKSTPPNKATSSSSTPPSSSRTSSSSQSGAEASDPSNTAGSNTTSPNGDNNSNNSDGLSTPAKAGIGIGVAVGVLLIGGNVAYCIWHYRKNRTPKAAVPPEYRYPGVPELGGNPRSELGGREMKMANPGGGMTQWVGPPRELDVPAELSPQARNVELEGGYPR